MPTDKKRKSKQGAMSPSEKEQAAERDAQSPVKKEKHKLNKSLVRDLITENGVKSDTVCSPRKRKLTNTATSEASSKKKKHSEDSGSVLVNSGFHSQGHTESSTSTKKKLPQHKFRSVLGHDLYICRVFFHVSQNLKKCVAFYNLCQSFFLQF